MKAAQWFLLATAGAIFSASPVLAEFQEDDITFTPQIGYYLPGGYRSLDNGRLAGLGVDFRINRPVSVEVFLGKTLAAEVELLQLRLDGLYHFRVKPAKRLIPYLSLGVGLNVVAASGAHDGGADPLLSVGGGLKYLLNNNWLLLRLDGRALIAGGEMGQLVTLGFCIPFGTRQFSQPLDYVDPKNRPAPVAEGGKAPAVDGAAALPTTVRAAAAAEAENTAAAPEAAEVAEAAEAAEVGATPVVVGAAVPERAELPAAALRAPRGPERGDDGPLAIEGKAVQASRLPFVVPFDFDDAALNAEGEARVAAIVAAIVAEERPLRLRIEGFTDGVGSHHYNIELGFRRARSVAARLAATSGIDPANILVKSVGNNKPIASNDKARGRAFNRRVEVVLLGEEERGGP